MYEIVKKPEIVNNEFLKKIGIDNVFVLDIKKNKLFLYINEEKKSFSFFDLTRKNASSKKKDFLLYLPKRGSFHAPDRELRQVVMKIISQKKTVIVINLSLLKIKPNYFEKYVFVSKLANKYNVSVFLTNLANKPTEILSDKEILAYLKLFKLKKENLANFVTFL